jgi:serine/threonine-protein kinase haspin
MPIEGTALYNDELQKTADEVLPEVAATLALQAMFDQTNPCSCPNFIRCFHAAVVRDAYPACLLEAWDDFAADESRECLNDRPDSFGDEQLYLVLAFENGGEALEDAILPSLYQAEVRHNRPAHVSRASAWWW